MHDNQSGLLPIRLSAHLAVLLLVTATPLFSQREPVLKQIRVPHHYYYREMYLPQLTSGPSSVAWAPDSRSVVYSMQGWLWRQALDSQTAQQLTSGPGYDYQPDCSADGKWVVFTKYSKDALELYALRHTMARGLKPADLKRLAQFTLNYKKTLEQADAMLDGEPLERHWSE